MNATSSNTASSESVKSSNEVLSKRTSSRSDQSSDKVIELLLNPKASRRIKMTEEMREKLVLHFRVKAQRLGRSMLRRWQSRMEAAEVDSIVDLSLCEAVQRFDPSKGASFMTFLFYHLKGNLVRAVSAAANANLVPSLEGEIEQATSYEQARSVNASEVAEALCNYEQPLPDEMLAKKQLAAIGTAACLKLDALEQEVIRRIYTKGEQLMDIASSLGYSRCHISRVKKKALQSLKQEVEKHLAPEEVESKKPASTFSERRLSRRIQRRRSRNGKATSMTREKLIKACA